MAKADQEKIDAADEFDAAIASTGFGCMNYILAALAFPMACAVIFSTSVVSFALTQIECDLDVSLVQMGLLNSITYMGMIAGGLFWAVIADLKGRRVIVIVTHLLDGVFAICASLAQTFAQIMVFKFFSGICIAGAYPTFMTYLSEMNSKKFRTRMLFFVGIMLSLAGLMIPILALVVLIHHWRADVYGFFYTSWQLFMTICAIPSLIVGISFCFLPESPKFDLSMGNKARASKTFEQMHRMNRSKGQFTEPTFSANTEQSDRPSLLESLKQLKILLTKSFACKALMLFSIEFFTLMCQNTLRLWTPVFFATQANLNATESENTGEFCKIIEKVTAKKYSKGDDCRVVYHETNAVQYTLNLPIFPRAIACGSTCNYEVSAVRYIGNIVLAVMVALAFLIVVLTVNRVGAKKILSISLLIATISVMLLYVIKGRYVAFMPFSIYLSVEYVSAIALINAGVTFFPTQVRTLIVSLTMIIGRIGSALGNIVFPHLMAHGCFVTILSLSVCTLFTFLVSLALPNPSNIKFD